MAIAAATSPIRQQRRSCTEIERAQLADSNAGRKALQRLQAAAVNEHFSRQIKALTHAMEENTTLLADTMHGVEVVEHLRGTRNVAAAAAKILEVVGADAAPRSPSSGPSI